jgi:hypothetical protein
MTSLNGLRDFARANGIPEEIALEVYERERLQLVAIARVQRFVSIIAEKHAKDVLMRWVRSPLGAHRNPHYLSHGYTQINTDGKPALLQPQMHTDKHRWETRTTSTTDAHR